MKIIRIARGKEAVVMQGDRNKCQAYMRMLISFQSRGVSGRGGKKYRVEYLIK